MNSIDGFLAGFLHALSPELLVAAFIGALLGTLVGVLPGIGPVAGAALILPLTFNYSPAVGIIMIAGIYLGAQYGGSTTSVLLNIPGDTSAIVATFDGHQMAKKGRAGAALTIMAIGSFIASTLGLVLLIASAQTFADFALKFGPAEYFAVTAGGLIVLSRITGGSLASGLLPMILGVVMATVGREEATGFNRFTFGNLDLQLGLNIATVAVGLYGISELISMIENKHRDARPLKIGFKDLGPTKEEWRRSVPAWLRGSAVGFIFGLLPVAAATLSTFASYRLEKAVSKHRDKIGTGAVEGIAGPEAANNSAAIAAMIPVLVLGIPFSATLALMLSAMIAQGIQPGPLILTQRPDLFWTVIAAVVIANVMLLALNLPLVGVWVKVLRIPRHILIPAIVVIAVIGAFSVQNNLIDVRLVLIIGALGYILKKLEFSLASLLVGLVLGPLIEKYFLQGMFISRGDVGYFVASPIAAGVWIVVAAAIAVSVFWTLISRALSRRSKSFAEFASLKMDDAE